eukprot:jgi/Galph1/1920/GphlegSOOS_G610.1
MACFVISLVPLKKNISPLCRKCNIPIKRSAAFVFIRVLKTKVPLSVVRMLGDCKQQPVAPLHQREWKVTEEKPFHKNINVLGSTGSIGTQTLEIVDVCPENFQVVALACGGSNIDLFIKQILKYRPIIAAVSDSSKADKVISAVKQANIQCQVLHGQEGVVECASCTDADMVVTGIVGCAGLLPTIAAIKSGKDIALANKETLIAGGPIIAPLVEKYGVKMVPADSEHSAIFQCLQGVPEDSLKKIILTASGGAFRDISLDELRKVSVKDALKHPNWSMGAKITIDSATMMNKGLEVIEAHFLFGTAYEDIQVVIHPQSIIHSMIELCDTSVLAQLGIPDMRLPLMYALSWPYRLPLPYPSLDLVKLGMLSFKEPDREKYPCLELAYEAGRRGGTMPAVLNAANEEAVARFRKEEITYLEIPEVIQATLQRHDLMLVASPSLEDILYADQWARTMVREYSPKYNSKHSIIVS